MPWAPPEGSVTPQEAQQRGVCRRENEAPGRWTCLRLCKETQCQLQKKPQNLNEQGAPPPPPPSSRWKQSQSSEDQSGEERRKRRGSSRKAAETL